MSCRGNLFQRLFKMSGSAISIIGLFYREKALVGSIFSEYFVYRCQNCGTLTVGVRCLPGLHNYWLLAIKHSCTSKSDSLPVGLIGMTNNNSNQNNPPDLLFKRNFWGTFVNICIFLFQRRAAFYYQLRPPHSVKLQLQLQYCDRCSGWTLSSDQQLCLDCQVSSL